MKSGKYQKARQGISESFCALFRCNSHVFYCNNNPSLHVRKTFSSAHKKLPQQMHCSLKTQTYNATHKCNTNVSKSKSKNAGLMPVLLVVLLDSLGRRFAAEAEEEMK